MQDERRRDLIDDGPMPLTFASGRVEELVGLVGGQALVAEMDGQTGELAKRAGKGAGFGGLRAFVAGKVQREANHQPGNAEAAGQTGQGAKIVAAVETALQRENGLGGEAKLVGHGDADAAIAHIEAEKARLVARAQLAAPQKTRLKPTPGLRFYLHRFGPDRIE